MIEIARLQEPAQAQARDKTRIGGPRRAAATNPRGAHHPRCGAFARLKGRPDRQQSTAGRGCASTFVNPLMRFVTASLRRIDPGIDSPCQAHPLGAQPSSPDATSVRRNAGPTPLPVVGRAFGSRVASVVGMSSPGVAWSGDHTGDALWLRNAKQFTLRAATNTPVFPCLRQRTCQLVVTHRHSALLPRTSRRTG